MGLNIFEQAAVAPKKETKAPKTKEPVVEIKGIAQLARLSAVITVLEALKDQASRQVDSQTKEWFIQNGLKLGTRPENFKGTEDGVIASCQMKKKRSNVALSDSAVALYTQYGIPYETVTDNPDTFIVNPKYAGDQVLLSKVSKALEKVSGFPPDFIEKLPVVTSRVPTDESISSLFTKREDGKQLKADTISAIFDVVADLSNRPTAPADNVNFFVESVKRILTTIKPAEAVAVAEAAKEKKKR